MVEINRAIDRGIDSLDIKILGDKAAFCSADPLRPANTDVLSTAMQQAKINNKNITGYLSQIKSKPITDQLHNLPAVSVKLISESDLEPLWNQMVGSYHYLGYQKLIGHRLKYLALIEDQPVAALSWSAPALKLAARDQYIGWSTVQRKRHLNQLASNSRFLILPWVKIPNLASHVLSLNIAQLKNDWPQHFNTQLLVLETFVDSRYFKGTCYKAANWLHVGDTYGSAKLGKGYCYHGTAKEIYLYVLEPKFRSIIGCQQKAPSLFHRPPPTKGYVAYCTSLVV